MPGNCQNPEFCVNIPIASSDHYVVRPPHISPFFLNFVLGLIRLRHINVILKSNMNNVVTEDILTSFPKIMFASITTFARKNNNFRLNIKERLPFCLFPNREWVWKKWRQIFVELKFSRPIKIGSTGKTIMNSQ